MMRKGMARPEHKASEGGHDAPGYGTARAQGRGTRLERQKRQNRVGRLLYIVY